MTAVADATDTLYEGCRGVSLPIVVYRKHLEAGREHSGATELPDRPANAQTVDQIQVDDVFDVIRSRRWENPTLRIQRTVGIAGAAAESGEGQPEDEPAPTGSETDAAVEARNAGGEDPASVQSP